MQFDIITIFPEILDSYWGESIIKRAQETKKIKIKTHNLRDWTKDKHRTVDDTPYGGGAGMVMKPEPIERAVKDLRGESFSADRQRKKANCRVVLLSAGGKQFDQKKAEEFAELEQLILICGRYEGVDQRVADHVSDEEISIGPYVLTGGELPAAVIVDSVSRLLPGVLGNKASLEEESFSFNAGVAGLEYPQYTKPESYKDWKVPEVLLSGNHAEIAKWRKEQQKPRQDNI